MTTTRKPPRFTIEIETPSNGKPGKSTVLVVGPDGKVLYPDSANLTNATERGKLVKRLAVKLGADEKILGELIEAKFNEQLDERRRFREKMEAGSPEAAELVQVDILDGHPDEIKRPLACLGGRGYATTWLPLQVTIRQSVDRDTGAVVKHDPPLVDMRTIRVVVRDDGKMFADVEAPGFEPLDKLGLTVRLHDAPQPDKLWSGAGVKQYVAGARPVPADVFGRLKQVIDRFIDFKRSLGGQEEMCEMTACYVVGTYLLDAFDVVGYLWPNGDKGAGKTTFLSVVAELGYLGQVILAGSTYSSLRDLADYGAVLAFDDAEAVMDAKKTDPDKRALLLAGNRRGALIAVKDLVGKQWVTRYVHCFCPRLFSAIRLPDEVLGSRAIVVPLVRSNDARRAKANPQDHSIWPAPRRQLLDDLWSVALTNLPRLREYDASAAGRSDMVGRDLEPWRIIFAVSLWLQEEHGLTGLFDRMSQLSERYRQERSDLGAYDPVRVAIKALDRLTVVKRELVFSTKELADLMNKIAVEDGLIEDGPVEDNGDSAEGQEKQPRTFTNANKVGWILRRQRFEKATRDKRRHWKTTRADVEAMAQAYGMQLKSASDQEPEKEAGADEMAFG